MGSTQVASSFRRRLDERHLLEAVPRETRTGAFSPRNCPAPSPISILSAETSRVQKKSRLCLTADIRRREFGVLRIILSECESSYRDLCLEPLRFSNLRHDRSRVRAAGISAALELNHGGRSVFCFLGASRIHGRRVLRRARRGLGEAIQGLAEAAHTCAEGGVARSGPWR